MNPRFSKALSANNPNEFLRFSAIRACRKTTKRSAYFPTGSKGLGFVEVLMAIVCFLIAALPIISIFSFNIENAKVIHARALSYSAAQEILNQLQLIPLMSGIKSDAMLVMDLPNTAGLTCLGSKPDPRLTIALSALPPSFSRKIIIDCAKCTTKVVVKSEDQPRADIEMERTMSENMGGRAAK